MSLLRTVRGSAVLGVGGVAGDAKQWNGCDPELLELCTLCVPVLVATSDGHGLRHGGVLVTAVLVPAGLASVAGHVALDGGTAGGTNKTLRGVPDTTCALSAALPHALCAAAGVDADADATSYTWASGITSSSYSPSVLGGLRVVCSVARVCHGDSDDRCAME